MSKGRTLLSRPRTKVYESNYNLGQNYYKSAIDGLDRKYGGRSASSEPATNGGAMAALRASLDRERETQKESPRALPRDIEEDEFFSDMPRRKANATALLGEFDSIFESRLKNGVPKEREASKALRAMDDEADEEFAASMKRIKAARAARAAAEDMEELESSLTSKRGARAKVDFSDKLIESVGISGKARAALEEEAVTGKRRVLKITASSVTEGGDDSGDLTRWTAIKSGSGRKHVLDEEETESAASLAASARARKSRARLDDLEAEMQALSDRGAAREKRVRDLKALVQENEMSAKEQIHSAVRVKSSIQSEKKVISF